MRHTILSLAAALAAVAALAAPPALAQQGGKTAIVDVQKLLHESDAGKGAIAAINKLRADYQQTLKAEEQELRGAEQKLNSERAVITPDAYQQRQQALALKFQGYQRNLQQNQVRWDAASRLAAQKIDESIVKIVDAIEKERQIAMVFDRTAVVGTAAAPDITPDVLKRLNEQLRSVPIEMPQ